MVNAEEEGIRGLPREAEGANAEYWIVTHGAPVGRATFRRNGMAGKGLSRGFEPSTRARWRCGAPVREAAFAAPRELIYVHEDVSDAISEGRDVSTSIYPAFRSYASMLGHIASLHPQNGAELVAR